MKIVLPLILLLVSANLAAQTKEVVLQGDSLIIRDKSITRDVFNFGRDPLAHLRLKVKFSKPVTEISTVANRHVDNQVDTAFAIKFGLDSFRVYKWGDGENALLSSDIRTERFVTKHGIKVGMTKAEIETLLEAYDISLIPKYLVLENLEYPESLRLEFSKDTLKVILFQGYFD